LNFKSGIKMDEKQDLSVEKHNLLIEETRQSFFQLENLTTALDNKAYGMIVFNTILISIFGYIIINYFNSPFAYIALGVLIESFVFLLLCVYLRGWERVKSKESIKLFDKSGFKEITGQLAVNYVNNEEFLYKIYYNKLKYLRVSFYLTIIAIFIEAPIIMWLIIFGH